MPLTPEDVDILKSRIWENVPSDGSSIGNYALMRALSDDMLLYKVSGRLVYQNRLKSSCPGLASDNDIIVTEQFGSQQCRGDIIKLVDRLGGIPGPFCVLGDFVPYRKVAAAQ